MLWNLKYFKLSYSKARYFKDASLLKQTVGKWVVNTKNIIILCSMDLNYFTKCCSVLEHKLFYYFKLVNLSSPKLQFCLLAY